MHMYIGMELCMRMFKHVTLPVNCHKCTLFDCLLALPSLLLHSYSHNLFVMKPFYVWGGKYIFLLLFLCNMYLHVHIMYLYTEFMLELMRWISSLILTSTTFLMWVCNAYEPIYNNWPEYSSMWSTGCSIRNYTCIYMHACVSDSCTCHHDTHVCVIQ